MRSSSVPTDGCWRGHWGHCRLDEGMIPARLCQGKPTKVWTKLNDLQATTAYMWKNACPGPTSEA